MKYIFSSVDNESHNCWSFFINNTCYSNLLQFLSPDLLHKVPDSLPLILGHHLLEATVVAGHMDAQLLVTHLSFHGASSLHAPVLHLPSQHVPRTSILVAVLVPWQVRAPKVHVDSAVKVAAGVVVSDGPKLAWV